MNSNIEDEEGKPYNKEKSESNRYEACMIVKREGNTFYEQKEYRKAIESYEKLLRYLGVMYKGEKHLSDPVKLTCELNIAQSYIKLEEHGDALTHCNQALEIEPTNIKALYRRSKCYTFMGKYDDAKTDIDTILGIEPENRDALKELQQINVKLRDLKTIQKKQFSGMFNRGRIYQDRDIEEKVQNNQLTDVEHSTSKNPLLYALIFTAVLVVMLILLYIQMLR
ncbi:hypothetical protein AKO1_014092 [Acrasis kona]|uniref:Uncharacterized protein n=1 Tax=Acrasis kona TaxID=1008807 RepID=A0AAW2Z0J8_9EUKA